MRPWSMLEGATPNYSAWGITGAGSSVGVLLKCPTPGPRGPASPSHDFPPLYLIRAREIFVGPIVTNFGANSGGDFIGPSEVTSVGRSLPWQLQWICICALFTMLRRTSCRPCALLRTGCFTLRFRNVGFTANICTPDRVAPTSPVPGPGPGPRARPNPGAGARGPAFGPRARARLRARCPFPGPAPGARPGAGLGARAAARAQAPDPHGQGGPPFFLSESV